MSTEFDAAIAAFERDREEALKNAAEYERTINALCKKAGYPPRYPGAENGTLSATGTAVGRVQQISDDTFYGQKQTPAMRMYLEMRRAQGLGPATPREIYDAIKQGGYVFDAKSPDIAMVGMRALLRTQPNVFHRLPQGTYGLTSWYPDAKKPKLPIRPNPKKKTATKKVAVMKLRKPGPAAQSKGPVTADKPLIEKDD
jgi:hypothetical protein